MDEIKIWAIEGSQVSLVQPTNRMDSEKHLEEILVKNPELLMPGLTLVGRQTQTEGGPLDLLGVDSDGRLVVFELKRGMLSRNAVAQIIDYVSYLEDMDLDALVSHISDKSGAHSIDKIDDFEKWYTENENIEVDSLDSLRPLRMFLVGLGVDDKTERMVNFLTKNGMDISLLTFYGFEQDGKVLLARQMRVEGQEKYINPLKNDNVTLFARKVAGLAIDRLPDNIKPKSKNQFAHDRGHRSYCLWYPSPWSKVALYYKIGINPGNGTESCTDAFISIRYDIHWLQRHLSNGPTPGSDEANALISTLEKLDIQENQRHDKEDNEKGRIRVDYGKNELNDDFAETLAKTLGRFIKVATPAVDAFVNERNKEEV